MNARSRSHWRAADLRAVYTAPAAEAAEQELLRFGEKWDQQYSPIRSLWQRHWQRVIPFFASVGLPIRSIR